MNKSLVFFGALIALVFAMPIAAQAESAVFAPFVSRLEGESWNNLVRLTWMDSKDVRGPVFIYRSDVPFEGENSFAGITPVRVPYGVQYFDDEIEPGVTFYYFAAASDEEGRMYDIIISSGNYIGVRAAEAFSQVLVPTEATPAVRNWDGVTSLEAVSQGERVVITFSPGAVRSAALYRSVRPIKDKTDLLGALMIQARVFSPYIDFPIPGIPYYYAVISEEELERGIVNIVPGLNATLSPVGAYIGDPGPSDTVIAAMMPLPQLPAQEAVAATGSYTETPAAMGLSLEALLAMENYQFTMPENHELRRPRVFRRDLEADTTEIVENALVSIVLGPFSNRDWQTASEELVSYLAVPRTQEERIRAKFYLGQCYYFLNRPRDSLFEFLAIQERYPDEAAEWIQSLLEIMTNQ